MCSFGSRPSWVLRADLPWLSRGTREGHSREGYHSKWRVLYVIPYHLEWCPWASSHFKILCLLYSFQSLFWCIAKTGFHIWEGATWGREGKHTLIRWWSAPLVNTSLPHPFHEEKFLTAFFSRWLLHVWHCYEMLWCDIGNHFLTMSVYLHFFPPLCLNFEQLCTHNKSAFLTPQSQPCCYILSYVKGVVFGT